MCGPEVLAEVLRRRSGSSEEYQRADVETLAKEMKTDERGTTLAGLARAARKHGFTAKGLRLTWKGLRKRFLRARTGRAGEYVIALVQPEHYVLVEDVTAGTVRVWDPSGAGRERPGVREYPPGEWERLWAGVVLVLKGGGPGLSTLQRIPGDTGATSLTNPYLRIAPGARSTSPAAPGRSRPR